MKITSMEEFEQKIQTIALVDFYADWCGPCKMLLPIIEEIEKEVGTKCNIVKVNVDDFSELAAKYEVQTIPTLIYFKDGKEVHKTIGFKPKDEILKTLGSL